MTCNCWIAIDFSVTSSRRAKLDLCRNCRIEIPGKHETVSLPWVPGETEKLLRESGTSITPAVNCLPPN